MSVSHAIPQAGAGGGSTTRSTRWGGDSKSSRSAKQGSSGKHARTGRRQNGKRTQETCRPTALPPYLSPQSRLRFMRMVCVLDPLQTRPDHEIKSAATPAYITDDFPPSPPRHKPAGTAGAKMLHDACTWRYDLCTWSPLRTRPPLDDAPLCPFLSPSTKHNTTKIPQNRAKHTHQTPTPTPTEILSQVACTRGAGSFDSPPRTHTTARPCAPHLLRQHAGVSLFRLRPRPLQQLQDLSGEWPKGVDEFKRCGQRHRLVRGGAAGYITRRHSSYRFQCLLRYTEPDSEI